MKYATLLVLLTFALAPKAHAIHAYHSDWCRVAESELHLPFQLRANYDWIEATPLKGMQGDDSSITGSIVDAAKPLDKDNEFYAKKIKISNQQSKDYDDGCWTGTQGNYDAVIQLLNVSPKASRLGLKPGQEVRVHCTTEDIDPDGASC